MPLPFSSLASGFTSYLGLSPTPKPGFDWRNASPQVKQDQGTLCFRLTLEKPHYCDLPSLIFQSLEEEQSSHHKDICQDQKVVKTFFEGFYWYEILGKKGQDFDAVPKASQDDLLAFKNDLRWFISGQYFKQILTFDQEQQGDTQLWKSIPDAEKITLSTELIKLAGSVERYGYEPPETCHSHYHNILGGMYTFATGHIDPEGYEQDLKAFSKSFYSLVDDLWSLHSFARKLNVMCKREAWYSYDNEHQGKILICLATLNSSIDFIYFCQELKHTTAPSSLAKLKRANDITLKNWYSALVAHEYIATSLDHGQNPEFWQRSDFQVFKKQVEIFFKPNCPLRLATWQTTLHHQKEFILAWCSRHFCGTISTSELVTWMAKGKLPQDKERNGMREVLNQYYNKWFTISPKPSNEDRETFIQDCYPYLFGVGWRESDLVPLNPDLAELLDYRIFWSIIPDPEHPDNLIVCESLLKQILLRSSSSEHSSQSVAKISLGSPLLYLCITGMIPEAVREDFASFEAFLVSLQKEMSKYVPGARA